VRRHEVRTLHALHGAPEVPDVEKIPDDDLGAELAKVLGAVVFAADQGPDGESGTKEVLGYRAAGVAGSRGDENGWLCLGHLKTPEILLFFECCFIL
jgi:hypothetical protein